MRVDLNDRKVMEAFDPSGMLTLTERFPAQCREAWALAKAADLRPLQTRPGVVILAGMGGSAAGGDFARALFDAQGTAPFIVVRDPVIPHYVGVGDLVFCASYSGDTEETLAAYTAARQTGAHVVAITSGGELARRAETDGVDLIRVPGGQPPRTAFGFMTIPIVVAAERFRLLPEQPHEATYALLETLAEEWGVEQGEEPKALANKLHRALPILYGVGPAAALVANRWRSQINENAKQLAFSNGYPELDHNEIMGWVGAPRLGVARFEGIRLELGEDSKRAEITERLLEEAITFTPVKGRGDSLFARLLTLTHLADWVSLYLARLNEVDPADIGRIDELKTAFGHTFPRDRRTQS